MKTLGKNSTSLNKFSYLLILPFFFGFWSSGDAKKDKKKEAKQETVTQMKNVREV